MIQIQYQIHAFITLDAEDNGEIVEILEKLRELGSAEIVNVTVNQERGKEAK